MGIDNSGNKKHLWVWCILAGMIAMLVFLTSMVDSNETPPAESFAQELPIPRVLLINEAIAVPDEVRQRERARAASMAGPGYAPGWDRTSDFMIGRVAIGIILPESDGSVDPSTEDWTPGEIISVSQEIREGLNWWQAQAQTAGITLDFVVLDPITVSTRYEPINHPGLGPEPGLCGEENLWIGDVMSNLGYSDPDKTYRENVRQYDNDLRQRLDTDWAVTIFAADSSNDNGNDPEGENGYGFFKLGTWCGDWRVFGWSYRPGPFLVMSSQNAPLAGYGPDKLNDTTRHEIGHVFGAADEICSDDCNPNRGLGCDTRFGYLSVGNHNCKWYDNPSCDPPAPIPTPTPLPSGGTCQWNLILCVMRGADDELCPFSAGQVGWWDSDAPASSYGWPPDGNGLPDTIDTTPAITLTSYPFDPSLDRTPLYTGTAQDIPFHTAHPIYTDTTINTIVAVQYRVDGGSWQMASPADGAFDTAYEDYIFSPLLCQNGVRLMEARAVNSVGNYSAIASDTLTVLAGGECERAYLPIVLKSH